MNLKNKLLILTLIGLATINSTQYLNKLKQESNVNAGILQEANEYSDLTSSYFRIEGMVGDTLTDFVMDYKGKTVNGYTVQSDTNSIEVTKDGIKLVKSGEGTTIFKYADAICKIDYSIEANPDIKEEEEEEEVVDANTTTEAKPPVDMKYKTCTITSNHVTAKGIIMYIDDSKNAFKSTGTFYIEEGFLDGKTHTIYVAKFTNKGPVAYPITQFTSLAGEINFMNFNSDEVDINDLNINLKTDLNSLF